MTLPPPIPLEELLAQSGWVRRLARRLAHDAQSADDLTQGTLAAALENPPGPDRPLGPWLARVVSNLARKERRAASRRADRERRRAPAARSAPATDQLMAEMEEQQRIARFVGELREPYRTVLLLRYYRDQTAAEIGRSLDIPAATVRSRLARGLALLRERVEAGHGGDARRALGALLVAGGSIEAVPTSAGLAPLAPNAPLAQKLIVMKSSTKVLVASAACALVVTGVFGLLGHGTDDPISPDPTPALAGQAAEIVPETRDQGAERAPEASARERVTQTTGEAAAPKERELAPEEIGLTVFTARAVDDAGEPIEGAAFRVVTEEGEPRPFGAGRASGVDGRTEIAVESEAFFTYSGRDTSNTYMSLWAPGHARHFSVPAAKRGTKKDLGDILLKPGGSVTGRVIDAAGAPVTDALVVGTASWTEGDPEEARVGGPEREGGRPTALTDGMGRFDLVGLHVGPGLVWAGKGGKLWAVSDVLEIAAGAEEPGLELVLEELPREATIAGSVVDPQGAPVPNARLHYSTVRWREEKLSADAHGRFLIAASGKDTHRLVASDPEGRFGVSAEQRVAPGDVDVRIVLPERRTLHIRVVQEATGQPLERAAVIATPLQEQTSFMDAKFHRTDAEGLLDLPAPGDPFRISAGHTDFAYRKFGPFDPSALPQELFIELTQLPVITGVVLDGDEPVPGARVELIEACGERYRPLQNGFPLRLFAGGIEKDTSDAEGRFSVPTNTHARGAPVLLVEKEGYALAELQLSPPQPTAGVADVKVQMVAGGVLAGRVLVGPTRHPESVVVAISRGDGHPKFARPDANGDYRIDRLTPGSWRVEDRDAEPEGRVFGMAQGDEHPFRWDCEVRDGETTRYDLDLRWQDDLRVRGRLLFDGAGAAGWTAVLEAPDHSDRPWAPRPATLGEDGSFSLEARPGYAELVLRAPFDSPTRMMLRREVLIDQHLEPSVFELATGRLEGTLAEGALKLRLHHRLDAKTHIEATFASDADGRFAVEGFAAGEASFQHHVEGRYGPGWYGRGQVEIEPGSTTTVE